jgi:hypothetical protein
VVPQFNVYCDESCHLENDGQGSMLLGAVWCPEEASRNAFVRLREIKQEHDLSPTFELKWTKVSPAKMAYYRDVLDYFFDNVDLNFRAVVVPDKSKLRHADFGQTHDDWYYKMYFDMLKLIFAPRGSYRVYIDIKDTLGGQKVAKLHEVICNNIYDFSREIVETVQIVRSDEIELMQLADFLIGIVSYANRGLTTSRAKNELVARMRERSGYSLTQSTLYRENKVNLLRWQAAEPSRG